MRIGIFVSGDLRFNKLPTFRLSFRRQTKSCANYFFGQQVKGDARLVVLNARHGNLAVQPDIFVHDGYITVYYGADLRVFRHTERIRSSQELRRIVVDIDNGYLSSQRHRVRIGVFDRFVWKTEVKFNSTQ